LSSAPVPIWATPTAGTATGRRRSTTKAVSGVRRPSQRRRLSVDRRTFDFYHTFLGYPKATVAEVQGYALGGGFELALMADHLRRRTRHPHRHAGHPFPSAPRSVPFTCSSTAWGRPWCGGSSSLATASRLRSSNTSASSPRCSTTTSRRPRCLVGPQSRQDARRWHRDRQGGRSGSSSSCRRTKARRSSATWSTPTAPTAVRRRRVQLREDPSRAWGEAGVRAARRPLPRPRTLIVANNSRVLQRKKPQQIADELRALIVSGQLGEGDCLGREPELVERFGVSRPSLREALRILEAEGLITVGRGVLGGVFVHEPDQRMTARTAALVLADPQCLSGRRVRRPQHAGANRCTCRGGVSGPAGCRRELRRLTAEQEKVIEDPDAFGSPTPGFTRALSASPATRR